MTLKVGDKAPDFTSRDQDGKMVKLSGLKGKKIVLYFYPRDMTSGCTLEACNLRDSYKLLQKQGYEVYGLSTDDEKSHQKFIAKERLPFNLLADTDKAIHEKYGTWVQKSMYGRNYMGTARVTFIIDEKGTIEDIISKVDTRNHADQILGKEKSHLPAASSGTTAAKKKTTGKSIPKKSTAKKGAKKRSK